MAQAAILADEVLSASSLSPSYFQRFDCEGIILSAFQAPPIILQIGKDQIAVEKCARGLNFRFAADNLNIVFDYGDAFSAVTYSGSISAEGGVLPVSCSITDRRASYFANGELTQDNNLKELIRKKVEDRITDLQTAIRPY